MDTFGCFAWVCLLVNVTVSALWLNLQLHSCPRALIPNQPAHAQIPNLKAEKVNKDELTSDQCPQALWAQSGFISLSLVRNRPLPSQLFLLSPLRGSKRPPTYHSPWPPSSTPARPHAVSLSKNGKLEYVKMAFGCALIKEGRCAAECREDCIQLIMPPHFHLVLVIPFLKTWWGFKPTLSLFI